MAKKKINTKGKRIIVTIITIIVLLVINILNDIFKSEKILKKDYNANIGNNQSNLIASYIKKGVTIGGVEGTLEYLDTSDATATANNISNGKTAYVNGIKVTGNGVDVNNSYNEGYNVAKQSNKLIDNGVYEFRDPIDSTDASLGVKQLTLTVKKGAYVIITVTVRKNEYVGEKSTISCTSGMNVISTSANSNYIDWRKLLSNNYFFRIYYFRNRCTSKY